MSSDEGRIPGRADHPWFRGDASQPTEDDHVRHVSILMHGIPAGVLEESDDGCSYSFRYHPEYAGPPVSLTMPVETQIFEFDRFPPFFDGLLPEGSMLEAMLQQVKLDAGDYLGQLLVMGRDPVGAVTVEAME